MRYTLYLNHWGSRLCVLTRHIGIAASEQNGASTFFPLYTSVDVVRGTSRLAGRWILKHYIGGSDEPQVNSPRTMAMALEGWCVHLRGAKRIGSFSLLAPLELYGGGSLSLALIARDALVLPSFGRSIFCLWFLCRFRVAAFELFQAGTNWSSGWLNVLCRWVWFLTKVCNFVEANWRYLILSAFYLKGDFWKYCERIYFCINN